MKAVVLKDFGGVENLTIEEVAKPEVFSDEMLIHGAAGGVGSFAVQIAKKLGAYVYERNC